MCAKSFIHLRQYCLIDYCETRPIVSIVRLQCEASSGQEWSMGRGFRGKSPPNRNRFCRYEQCRPTAAPGRIKQAEGAGMMKITTSFRSKPVRASFGLSLVVGAAFVGAIGCAGQGSTGEANGAVRDLTTEEALAD